ncbi:MAG: ferrochelatase [Myxococcota bacterium]
MSVQVWLLSEGEALDAENVEPFLRAQLSDPFILQTPRWFRSLIIWWYVWLQQRALMTGYKQLPGPSPAEDHRAEQARLLARHLGKKYSTHVVFRYRSPDARTAAAGINQRSKVVLLPLQPHRCGALYSSVAAAQAAVTERGASHVTIPSYPSHPRYVEAVAETLRAAIVDLPNEHYGRYGVLFTAQLPAEGRGDAVPEHEDELNQTVEAVVQSVSLCRPYELGFVSNRGRVRAASTEKQLKEMARKGLTAVIVVPLAFTVERAEAMIAIDQRLADQASHLGIALVRAETVSGRPTFIRALAALIDDAMLEAGWKDDDAGAE